MVEDDLIQLGMKSFPAGRMVYPWPWMLLERMRQCLNSYLAHLEKASCYRLTLKIRERFFWLDEYFQWQKGKVVYRCPIPSRAMRFVNQKSWFKRHLPGHVLLIQQGGFWELDVESAALGEVTKNEALAAAKSWPRRFPDRRLRHLRDCYIITVTIIHFLWTNSAKYLGIAVIITARKTAKIVTLIS